MDRVIDLTAIVQREVADYAHVEDWKAQSYSVEDDKHGIYTVITVPQEDHPLLKKANVTVMARVVGDHVIVEHDITDRPLYKELMRSGIPREQIILAYAGEKLPDDNPS